MDNWARTETENVNNTPTNASSKTYPHNRASSIKVFLSNSLPLATDIGSGY
jgi:hypothetical protein